MINSEADTLVMPNLQEYLSEEVWAGRQTCETFEDAYYRLYGDAQARIIYAQHNRLEGETTAQAHKRIFHITLKEYSGDGDDLGAFFACLFGGLYAILSIAALAFAPAFGLVLIILGIAMAAGLDR
jgi:hypothetical protein